MDRNHYAESGSGSTDIRRLTTGIRSERCVVLRMCTCTNLDSMVYYMPRLYGIAQWRTQEFFSGGVSTNSVEDRGQRGRGSGGGSLLVRGSGGSCNLVQEISFHIVKFS